MKSGLWVVLILAVLVCAPRSYADAGPMVLFYKSLAPYQADATSNEALPIGNGKLAAMVYGGKSEEIVQFNEDTVWAGSPHDYAHAGAADHLDEIRKLVWAGQGQAAWKVAKKYFMSVPLRQSPYQPTAELHLDFGQVPVQHYRRQLDLTTATASVIYDVGDVRIQRDYFASYPDHVIVARLTASRPGQLSFTCSLTTPHRVVFNRVDGNDVVLHGAVTHIGRNGLADGIEFETRVRVLCEGGSVSATGSSLVVKDADAVTLILGAATNFIRSNKLGGDSARLCLNTVQRAAAKGYDAIRRDQLADYQALFNRVTLDLGTSEKTKLPTNERLQAIGSALKESGFDWHKFKADDLQLVALNFQMARYLIISGSRPGSQPLNLQGKWNNEVEPAWESKMTLNINEEMNYWPVEVTNLPECFEPLFAMVRDLSETGAKVAWEHYHAHGWVVHHNTDLWRGAAPINGPDGIWPTGGAWLCMHLWWHYQYSGDPNFLQTAYPLMKGAAQFFVDTLVKDPRPGNAGYLMTNPTFSPEHPNPALGDNGGTVAGTTMDSQLVRSLFTEVIKAGEILKVDKAFRQHLKRMRDQLPPDQIGHYGQLQEWLEDVDVPHDHHRHLSHLVDLMPAGVISPIYTPKLAAACEVVLDGKGDSSNNTSWSRAWKMCLRTRLLEGDHAYMILNDLLGTSHTDNLTFSRKGNENQIDGNLGALMGTVGMFLQSQHGEVFLLPALPTKMQHGRVTGLRARGGFTVDMDWQHHALHTAQIHSHLGRPCRLRLTTPLVDVRDGNQKVRVKTLAKDLYEFSTKAGHTYTVTATVP